MLSDDSALYICAKSTRAQPCYCSAVIDEAVPGRLLVRLIARAMGVGGTAARDVNPPPPPRVVELAVPGRDPLPPPPASVAPKDVAAPVPVRPSAGVHWYNTMGASVPNEQK